tara:strand:+ start:4667 stop:5266 length:600 start_codon:yes stop_codon:yes gene_type:complete
MDKIIIVGSGGHAKSCIDIISNQDLYEISGIVDNDVGSKILGQTIIGNDDDLEVIFKKFKNAVIGIGQIEDNSARINIYNKLKKIGFKLPTIISKTAYVSKYANIGEATFIMQGVILGPDSIIGKNCIINTFVSIEHGAFIGDNTHISTGTLVNGDVSIGSDSFIGSGTVIKNGINIGRNCFIKMGSIVDQDIADNEKF